jgi:hypothetical protein
MYFSFHRSTLSIHLSRPCLTVACSVNFALRRVARRNQRACTDVNVFYCSTLIHVACNYTCHKSCRHNIKASCVKLKSKADESPDYLLDAKEQTTWEKIRRVEEKITATQKEFDIEMRIKDGLTKISKAKGSLLKRNKKSMDSDTNAQIETSAKKLDILKHELHKCQIQLTGLYTALAANEKSEKAEAATLSISMIANLRPASQASALSGSSSDMRAAEAGGTNEVIKLSILDHNSKTELVKSFVVTKEETVRNLITRAIEKFNLEDGVDDYHIILKTLEDDVPLRLDDLVVTDGMDFPHVVLKMVSKLMPTVQRKNSSNMSSQLSAFKDASRSAGSLFVSKDEKRRSMLLKFGRDATGEDPIMARKQKEVFQEFSETETGYYESLRAIVQVFVGPLKAMNVLTKEETEGIFSNIKEIYLLHQRIIEKLELGKESVFMAMEAFDSEVSNFSIYNEYCGNQSIARRLLNKVKDDPAVQRAVSALETDPKLKKLGLPDLLVKPMHRITRYPLLLKRLLSHTRPNTAEYDIIDSLCTKFDTKVLLCAQTSAITLSKSEV